MSKKLTYNEVKNYIEYEISNWKPLHLLSNQYLNARSKLIIQDNEGYKYNLTFATIVQNYKRKQDFSKFDSRNIFTIENINLWLSINNIKYKLLSNKYSNIKDYLLWECDKGHIFKMSFDSLFWGSRCSICSLKNMVKSMTKTHNHFLNEVYLLVGDEYTVLGKYKKSSDNILIKHNKCGFEWSPKANSFLRGSRCPKCHGFYKTTDEVKHDIFNLVGDEYLLLGEYINSTTKINLLHNICGHTYDVYLYNFINGRRCPFCAESKGEQIIRHWLEDNNIIFLPEYDKFADLLSDKGNPLRFDFIIFNDKTKIKIKMLIEYDGIQHYEWVQGLMNYEGFLRLQIHDRLKDKYCKKHNMKLLRIPYWEFDNIESILTREINLNTNLKVS